MKRSVFVTLLAALGLAACGGAQDRVAERDNVPYVPPPPRRAAAPPPAQPETPDAPFRNEPPPAGQAPTWAPPTVEQFRLANGMTVLLVERHELPIVSVQFVTRRGGDDAPVARAGLASLVGTLLEQGTTRMSSLELSDAFAAIGAEHGTGMGWDSGFAYAKVLGTHLERALELLADVVQRPAFAPEEIERARARRLAALRQELDVPSQVANNLALRTVYGERHPYGRSLTGTEAAVRAITRAEILRFYRTHFIPADSALVVVGDVSRAALTPRLEALFGRWRAAAPAPRTTAPERPGPGPRIFLVDRPGAPQAHVLLAHAGVPRSERQYDAIVVMNTILGGMFSSRINLNLREQHAYTYGARSGFAFRHGAGPFAAGGAVAVASTGPAIRELLNELERMRTSDVTAAELEAAKNRLIDSLPARFETVDQVAGAISELFVYNLPLDEYATFPARIRAVTAEQVRQAAQTFVQPENARIVVVGDLSVVEPQLRALNLGEVQVRDALGERPGEAPSPVAAPPQAPVPAPGAAGGTRPNAAAPRSAAPRPAAPRPPAAGQTTR